MLFVLLALAALGGFLRVRGGAAAERKAVIARLREEDSARGALSPTDAVFHGLAAADPPPLTVSSGALRTVPVAPTAPGVTAEPGGDVAALFSGISLPAGLVPLVGSDYSPSVATFLTTSAGAGEVRAALSEELDRLGISARWTDEEACSVERDGRTGQVIVFPDAHGARHAEAPLFPTAPAGSCAVRLLAL